MRGKAAPAALLALVLVVLAGCGGSGSKGPIKIGVIANITGPDTLNGRDSVRGITLATEELNKAGGVDGRKIKLVVEDSEYKPVSGVNAARKLIDIDHVTALISNAGSSVVVPVAKYAQGRKTDLVNTGASSIELRPMAGTVYSMIPLDDIFTGGFAKWVHREGARRVAVLMPSNPFGTGLNTSFTKAFTALGGQVTAGVNFKEGQQDYRPDLQRIVSSKPEAIVTGAYGADAVLLWKQAHQIGLNVPWLVAYPTGLPIRNANGKLFGIDFGYNLPQGQAFRDAYEKRFHQKAQTASAVYAYDGMKMLGEALKKSKGNGGKELGAGLTATAKTFSGATGRIAFDRDGQRSSVPYVFLKEENDGTFVPLTQPIGFGGGPS
jgi:branched-chain amino acid transport system substrate-binding protein